MSTTITQRTPNSTAISKWSYHVGTDAVAGTLFVTFTNGSEYAYIDCPMSVVVPMLTQASLGRYFAHSVKPLFSDDKVHKLATVQHEAGSCQLA
jgi:hypothetical protein